MGSRETVDAVDRREVRMYPSPPAVWIISVSISEGVMVFTKLAITRRPVSGYFSGG